ncbi:MAG: tetratricopeptide repeat protein [Alphaproteobacteria bacterium]|nr:tetratricopeptide repeat protein [Alphaproteobacteria bacterium]
MSMNRTAPLLIMAVSALGLGGCQTIGSNRAADNYTSPSKEQRIDSALEKVALQVSKSGSSSAKLITLEKQYKRNSDNASYALEFARVLRQTGYLNRAFSVLKPFADKEESVAGVKTEMSMIALGLGKYNDAEKYAQGAIIQDPSDHSAYQNLGIALDAKEMHVEAERAFRKGLEYWEGDPTTIMNNLALNLATQGYIDDAVEILERAKNIAPNRIEIERNLRIIRTLNER